jgi:hypothetical protein
MRSYILHLDRMSAPACPEQSDGCPGSDPRSRCSAHTNRLLLTAPSARSVASLASLASISRTEAERERGREAEGEDEQEDDSWGPEARYQQIVEVYGGRLHTTLRLVLLGVHVLLHSLVDSIRLLGDLC